MKSSIIILAMLICLVYSCKNEKPKKAPMLDPAKIAKPLEKFNQEMIGVEDRQIDDYLSRRAWNMIHSKTGLRYTIYKEGKGLQPLVGQIVVLDYSIQLIRGEEVYNSKKDGKKIFRLDQDEEISGLHELVKYMKVGDCAKAIIPSYLAYGLVGDEKKIPRKATLIFDLQLKEIR